MVKLSLNFIKIFCNYLFKKIMLKKVDNYLTQDQEKEILNGIMLGLEDSKAGRVNECDEEHINNLKEKLRFKLKEK